MTSKIVVNNIEPDAGISTVSILGIATATNFKTGTTNVHDVGVEAAGINVLGADTPIGTGSTIYDDGGARFSGIVTATAFHGDASQMTGAGLGTDGSANTSGIITATAFVPTTGQLSHRNIIINGSMIVAQRGTTYTGSDDYATVDRFYVHKGTVSENPTQAQVDVTAGTTPYSLGFRKAYKITNGNQTLAAGSFMRFRHGIEAQDLANCGWNYTSTSSKITLSFWIKSSVAQNFYVDLQTVDGTAQNFAYETGSLTADTWTKIVKTIPGNSNLTFDNDTGQGMFINVNAYLGTNYSASGHTLDTWGAFVSGSRIPDMSSTWYTTDDATFELTGVQLEVGPVATPFEHRTFQEEELRCQRYFWKFSGSIYGGAYGGAGFCNYSLPTRMRIKGVLSYSGIRTTSSFYDYSSAQILQIQMGATNPYITNPQLDSEI